MTDRDLVAAFGAGDRLALASVYESYADELYAYCWSQLHDRDAAADALQATFIIVNARIGELADPDRLKPWMLALARHQCARVAAALVDDAPTLVDGPAPELPTDLARRVSDAIDEPTLAEHRAEVLASHSPFDDDFLTDPDAGVESVAGSLADDGDPPTELIPAIPAEPSQPDDTPARQRRLAIPVAVGVAILVAVGGVVLVVLPGGQVNGQPIAMSINSATRPTPTTDGAQLALGGSDGTVGATLTPATTTRTTVRTPTRPRTPTTAPTTRPVTSTTSAGSSSGTLSVAPSSLSLTGSLISPPTGQVSLRASGGPVSWTATVTGDPGGGLSISRGADTIAQDGGMEQVTLTADPGKEPKGSAVVEFNDGTGTQQVRVSW